MAIKKVNMRDKTAIKFMWESGDYSAPEISKELGVEINTVRSLIAREGWVKGAREEEIRQRIEREFEAGQDEIARETARNITDTRKEVYAFARSLNQQLIRDFTNAIKDGIPFAALTPNIKALKLLAETAKLTKEMRWDALDMSNPETSADEIPSLGVEELQGDEIDDLRNEQEKQYMESSVVDELLDAEQSLS